MAVPGSVPSDDERQMHEAPVAADAPDGAAGGGPRAVLEELAALVDELAGARWQDLNQAEAMSALDLVEQVERGVVAARAAVTAKVESDGMWALDGQRTFKVWLRDRTGTNAAESGRRVRQARVLRDHLPRARASLAAGRISAEHAAILVRETQSTSTLRHQLTYGEPGEEYLVEQAELMHAQDFAKLVAAWKVRADPEGAGKAWRDADAREELTISPTTDGYHVAGWLDELSGQVVTTALAAHAGRKGADDDRTSAQRRAGALVALAHQSLDAGLQQAGAKVRPHITVTVSLETMQALAAATGSVIPPEAATAGWAARTGLNGSREVARRLPPNRIISGVAAGTTLTAPGGPRCVDDRPLEHDNPDAGPSAGMSAGLDPAGDSPPGTDPAGDSPPGTDPPGDSPPGTDPPGDSPPGTDPPGGWPPGADPVPGGREGDDGAPVLDDPHGNLVDAFGLPLDRGPGASSELDLSDRAREWMQAWEPGDDHVISTAIDHDVLQGTEPARLADGTPIPPSMLARLACGSSFMRVIFGPESTVLDVGREQRIHPAHMTRAIHARDGHCQYPGCDEPPAFGEVHHSQQWMRDNGPTDVEHGVLLCWHHHDLVHTREITIVRTRGQWRFHDRFGQEITASGVRPGFGYGIDEAEGIEGVEGADGA
ncbi:DUF222 domain-containing protein [Georgenia sp. Z1344]|uniref:HNH endonuclease signature motif containing protein n=1 Tax=Georgenia sp. Z1344 TaxID=3416706 RepID=UPI003CF00EE4